MFSQENKLNSDLSSGQPSGLLGKLRAMPNESASKMLIVTISLCFVCSIIVSSVAIELRPLQDANKALEKNRVILEAAGLLEENKTDDIQALFDRLVDVKIVNLSTGEYVDSSAPKAFDQRKAARDPLHNHPIPKDHDIAKIKQRAQQASVYLVQREGKLQNLILPIHGYGLWSTMYGFLAFEADINTIAGLSFYEHAETPGLGGEIDNPRWRARWVGKISHDDQGFPQLQVIKGRVDPSRSQSIHQVDGIAGASLTSAGVNNMIRYWLGNNGFGHYLARLRTEKS
uniref:Na(+)-translocating NADH-quinone reductase subunit C n=1 Tax=Candidatus Kentrum sp. TUN TaxID=2126343 RepID=A0A450ZSU0_9GAMM|nr:MAG: Na+-transporting NADH:ubiquinone oxidoreductase subunit C [Candidatus Kentron sp. TUN]VFK56843.1 MAG: Na+-transporting NADH:ubiquinone oxidoreductase subunit C [Candidatus Kentron sp. TUN]VFK57465.1 MAG: Na+-transporting NADH:ubiquinone oxidoreductase subunit C [Candidatus Kentron sp. TUN]